MQYVYIYDCMIIYDSYIMYEFINTTGKAVLHIQPHVFLYKTNLSMWLYILVHDYINVWDQLESNNDTDAIL